jgi:hypothetical protein
VGLDERERRPDVLLVVVDARDERGANDERCVGKSLVGPLEVGAGQQRRRLFFFAPQVVISKQPVQLSTACWLERGQEAIIMANGRYSHYIDAIK